MTKEEGAYYPGKGALSRPDPVVRERRQAEWALQESEDRFRVTFDHATIGVAQMGLEGRWLRVNRKLCDVLGYTSEELLGMTLQDITYPADLEADLAYVHQLQTGEIQSYSIEKRCFRKDGFVVWIDLTVALVRGPSGEPAYFIAFIQDIGERKRIAKALYQGEELYRAVLEKTAENILVVDLETERILEANAALCRSLGYTVEELQRMTLYDIFASDQEVVDPDIWPILEKGSFFVGERAYRRRDDSLMYVEVSLSTIPYGGKEALCILSHDITERKQVEENLRGSLSMVLALREAGQILGCTLESEEVVSRLLEIMQRVSNLTSAVISLQGEDGQVSIWRSMGLEKLWRQAYYTPEALDARRATLETEEHQLFLLQQGSGSEPGHILVGLCLPLRIRDRLIGVLEAYGPGSLAENGTIEILDSLASQAAGALENAQLYGELGKRERQLQDLVGKLMEAQEEERRRVAYEVHDGLTQVVTAAHQHLQAFARRHPPATEMGRKDLERILRLVRQTISDARKVIADLRPTLLDDFGLAAAISSEIECLREDGYVVGWEEELGDERLPAAVEIALFRIAQEALRNVRKHAETRRVCIKLRRQGNEVHLKVRDYGRGFDPTMVASGNGPGERVGLAGMRERVSLLGGNLKIDSQPGVGTSIAVEVPLSRVLGHG